jgi:hypothetical protein
VPPAVGDLDDDIDGWERVAELWTGHRQDRPFAAILVVFHPESQEGLSLFCGGSPFLGTEAGAAPEAVQGSRLARKLLI